MKRVYRRYEMAGFLRDARLSERERGVLQAVIVDGVSLRDHAANLGLSPQRVVRIKDGALRRLGFQAETVYVRSCYGVKDLR